MAVQIRTYVSTSKNVHMHTSSDSEGQSGCFSGSIIKKRQALPHPNDVSCVFEKE